MPVALLRVQQTEERGFFGVVGLRGITGRGADAAIALAQQIFGL